MFKKLKPYVVSILIALVVGGLSALLTRNNMNIYNDYVMPPLAPPAWLFPIAWGILYVLMGISAGHIITHKNRNPKAASEGLSVYYLSLFVNFFWSIIFFNMRFILLAFIWLLLLLGLVIFTVLKYRKVSHGAAYLQIPYILWLIFAGYLNLSIYILN